MNNQYKESNYNEQMTYVQMPDGGLKFFPKNMMLVREFFDAHNDLLKEKQEKEEKRCGAV